MAFSELLLKEQCGRLTTGIDPLLNLFFRLHVASDLGTEADFKARAASRMRTEGLYRRWKLPQEAVERGLLERGLTPLAFYALSRLYGVSVRVRAGRCWFNTASELPAWVVDARRCTLFKFSGDADLCEVPNPGKPLNSVSSYTARQLADLAAVLRVAAPKDATKAVLYAAAQRSLEEALM